MSSPTRLPLIGVAVASTGRRSAALAAWGTAFLQGRVAMTAAVAAVTGTDEPHTVSGRGEAADLCQLLTALRAGQVTGLRLVLPVPGDPRGLPGPGPFTDRALMTGEAVRTQGPGAAGCGLVPGVSRHGSDADGYAVLVHWRAFESPSAPPDPVGSRRQAAHDLTDGLREAAVALAGLDTARLSPEAAVALAGLRATRGRASVPVPASHPGEAQALWVQADRLQSIVDIAGADDGGAVDRATATERRASLRSLAAVARRAKVAAINAPLEG